MNKKGYTLVEVIVSIMILSIASIMLAGTFSKIIHYMSKSNAIKNASNDMLAYAEGTNDNDIRESITKKDKNNQVYKINGKIIVSGTLSELTSNKTDEINLHQFYTDATGKLKELPSYKDNQSFGDQMYERIDNLIAGACSTDYCDSYGHNILLKLLYLDDYHGSYKSFDKSLLPSAIAISGKTYYVRLFFPWEAVNGKSVISGGPLIYLSEFNVDYIQGDKLENLQVIYDYDAQIWYYHDNRIGNNYKLSNYESYRAGYDSNLLVNDNGKLIQSWSDFKAHIKNPANGWRYLDGDSIYDSKKSVDEYWLPVK